MDCKGFENEFLDFFMNDVEAVNNAVFFYNKKTKNFFRSSKAAGLAADFFYYWAHRAVHEWNVGWAAHQVLDFL